MAEFREASEKGKISHSHAVLLGSVKMSVRLAGVLWLAGRS
jgi:hypothetical protein